MATIALKGSGQKMPLVGFGLWKIPRAICAETVYNAIKAGYRLLDGAGDYGNEIEAGEGVARAIKEGLIKREDIFITSKLWNSFHTHDQAKTIAKYQLDLWKIDYFDLYLIHFPVALEYIAPEKKYPPEWWGLDGGVYPANIPLQETWKALEELHDEGLAKNIGVSNYNGSVLLDLVRYARVQPSVLQIEHHPYLVQQPLVDLAKHLGLAVTAYSSFGAQSWWELGLGKDIPSLLEHNAIVTISKRANKTPAQVLLRWATQRGLAVVPKSNDPTRLVQNLQVDDFDLTPEELKSLSALDNGTRLNNPAGIHPQLAIFA